MKWRGYTVLTVAAALVAAGGTAYVRRGVVFEALDKRPVPEVEVIDYYSDTIDQAYRLYVQLPPGYDPNGPRYPVLYATDGDAAIGIYDELVLPLIRQRKIPPIITVGIGYKDVSRAVGIAASFPPEDGANAALNAGQVRIRDYTPAATDHTPFAGGAPAFLAFITQKIVPFIDATYHTDPEDRAIAGHSLGGLFSLYAGLSAPDVFNRCISTSPSLFWGRRAIFDCEDAFAKEHREWDARLYLGLGTDESTILAESAFDMMERLSNRHYSELATEFEWHKGENHMSVILPANRAGLEFVY